MFRDKGVTACPLPQTWRQLWRVLEMSDVILLITDARHPVRTGIPGKGGDAEGPGDPQLCVCVYPPFSLARR